MFAKVYSQIFDSSIAEDYRVRLVFEDFLKLADKDGIVDMTRESIARRTNVPLEIVVHGVSQLESPDHTSRTPDQNGSRIVRLDAHRDWGWQIVNYRKYRESADKEMLRMAEADRKKEYRRRKNLPPRPPTKRQEGEGEAEPSRTRPPDSKDVWDVSGTNFPECEIPSWEEFWTYCQQITLVAEWFARDKFDAARQENWKRQPNWRAYADRVNSWWVSDGRPMEKTHRIATTTARVFPETKLRHLDEQIARHPANPQSLVFVRGKVTTEQKADLANKREERRQLQNQIASSPTK